MRAQNAAKVPDPRQDALSRAMNGVRWVTVAQRNQIIQSAKKKYAQALARARAINRARR